MIPRPYQKRLVENAVRALTAHGNTLAVAAHRGQLAHVEALLQAGAQPDLRQTAKDSERGDTALLRAFYGGHLAVAQRLVKAGASLQARNRWDWGACTWPRKAAACRAWIGSKSKGNR